MIVIRSLRKWRSTVGLLRPSAPVLTSADAYARWAADYPPLAHNALMRAEEAGLLALMPPLVGRLVLDLACGTGRYGKIVLESGARVVIGVDNSPHMLAAAALKSLVLGMTEAIPLASDTVDVLICGLALGHLPRLEPTLGECARVLRSSGVALISDVHPCLFMHGAQRTFSSGGRTFAVEHHVHLYSEYHRAAQAAGLRVDAVAEPRALAQDAAASPSSPLAIVYRMIKT